MSVKLIDGRGIVTFIKELKNIFATKANVTEVKESTDPYIFEIDYTELEFDTNFIVTGDGTSPAIGIGQVGFLIIAES